jgi:hypothetical protein
MPWGSRWVGTWVGTHLNPDPLRIRVDEHEPRQMCNRCTRELCIRDGKTVVRYLTRHKPFHLVPLGFHCGSYQPVQEHEEPIIWYDVFVIHALIQVNMKDNSGSAKNGRKSFRFGGL